MSLNASLRNSISYVNWTFDIEYCNEAVGFINNIVGLGRTGTK